MDSRLDVSGLPFTSDTASLCVPASLNSSIPMGYIWYFSVAACWFCTIIPSSVSVLHTSLPSPLYLRLR